MGRDMASPTSRPTTPCAGRIRSRSIAPYWGYFVLFFGLGSVLPAFDLRTPMTAADKYLPVASAYTFPSLLPWRQTLAIHSTAAALLASLASWCHLIAVARLRTAVSQCRRHGARALAAFVGIGGLCLLVVHGPTVIAPLSATCIGAVGRLTAPSQHA